MRFSKRPSLSEGEERLQDGGLTAGEDIDWCDVFDDELREDAQILEQAVTKNDDGIPAMPCPLHDP